METIYYLLIISRLPIGGQQLICHAAGVPMAPVRICPFAGEDDILSPEAGMPLPILRNRKGWR